MDPSPVPFPTLPLQAEEAQREDTRPSLSSRVHSSPSLPNLWLPALHGSAPPHLAQRFQARYRPHLRPLDLAAPPACALPKSKYTSSKRSTSGSPCRPPLLLTPPLTPSSSFNSIAPDGPSTPPEASSSLRWLHPTDRSFPGSAAIPDSPTALKGHAPLPHGGYLTPSSGRSHSISSDTDSGYAPSASSPGADALSALAAGLASADITPREERKASFCTQGQAGDASPAMLTNIDLGRSASDIKPSHFLLVRNVHPSVSNFKPTDAFAAVGEIKGIWMRFQESHGIVILAFFDVRHAMHAQRQIGSQPLPGLEDCRLEAGFVSAEQLELITGKSDFVDATDGTLLVSVANDRRFQGPALQNLLSSFGDLMSFEVVDQHDDMWHVEYYDVRDAANAHRALHNRIFLGVRLRLFTKRDLELAQSPESDHPSQAETGTPATSYGSTGPAIDTQESFEQQQQIEREMRCSEGRVRPRSVSAGESIGAPDAMRRLWKGRESPQEHSRRCSNDLFFDAVGKVTTAPQTPTRPRSISIGPDDLAGTARSQRSNNPYALPSPTFLYHEDPYSHTYTGAGSSAMYIPQETYFAQSAYGSGPAPYSGGCVDPMLNHNWTFAAPPVPNIEYCIPPSPRAVYHQPQPMPVTPRKPLHAAHQRQSQRQGPSLVAMDEYRLFGSPHTSSAFRQHAPQREPLDMPSTADARIHANGDGANGQNISEKNQLNVEAIEQGKDMRTTVMIKNIPNKMSDKDLLAFIGKVCPRRIDFLYLRMDFQNGCNVGYAFVNFITVGDLLHFAKTQLGVKWNMYSSEKVLQMCYATYQGKEALVEKFKNSCIMDERESWRPKIFYSDGSNQGLPEPFPPPTHLRRKERSSHNRGALFVPGAHYQRRDASGNPAMYHHRPHPPRLTSR